MVTRTGIWTPACAQENVFKINLAHASKALQLCGAQLHQTNLQNQKSTANAVLSWFWWANFKLNRIWFIRFLLHCYHFLLPCSIATQQIISRNYSWKIDLLVLLFSNTWAKKCGKRWVYVPSVPWTPCKRSYSSQSRPPRWCLTPKARSLWGGGKPRWF